MTSHRHLSRVTIGTRSSNQPNSPRSQSTIKELHVLTLLCSSNLNTLNFQQEARGDQERLEVVLSVGGRGVGVMFVFFC